MKCSVVVPARNEAQVIEGTVEGVAQALEAAGLDYEIIVVDDASTDGTAEAVARAAAGNARISSLRSHYANGFGFAVRAGFDVYTGDAVAIVMADASDDPADLVRYFSLLGKGYECAFGSRFVPGAEVIGYPGVKRAINRMANLGIRVLFRHRYNDTTNAFKAYRREVIENCMPLVSNHFNLTVELPLKAIVRGHSYATIPVRWINRERGESKLQLREMGSRYLYVTLMVFLEHHLSSGDYRRPGYAETRSKLTDGRLPFPRRPRGRDGRPAGVEQR